MSDTTQRRPTQAPTVRWYARLSLWLALSFAAGMLAFHYFLGPVVDREIYGLFGLPDPEKIVTFVDTRWISEELLEDAELDGPGHRKPRQDRVETFGAVLAETGSSFVWLDADGDVVTVGRDASGELLPWAVDRRWPFPLDAYLSIELPSDPPRTVRATTLPVHMDDETAGHLVMLLVDAAVHAEELHGITEAELDSVTDCEFAPDDKIAFIDSQLVEESLEQESILDDWIQAGLAVATSLLVAMAVSLLVTRRLSRLAAAATVPVEEEGDLPGPFEAHGWDEVASLARAMNAMRARVTGLVDRIAERDVRRREWVAQVSHDLRTPLTALMACLDRTEQVLENDDPARLKQQIRELVAVARLDADRVNVLADDLLDIARLDAADTLHVEPVPPGELVRNALTELGPLAESRGLTLEPQVEPNLPDVQADGRRLIRALENLLRNAIHHAQHHIRVQAAIAGTSLRLAVMDDGVGFPETEGAVDLQRLRGRRSRDDSAGLGLLVTQRVAEAHGGDVGAYNQPEGGATVWFTIPMRQQVALP